MREGEREWSGVACPEAEGRDGDFATFPERERERERTVTPYDDSHRQISCNFHFWSFHFPDTKSKASIFLSISVSLHSSQLCFSSILRSAVLTHPLIPTSFRHLITFRGSESSLEFFSSRGFFEVSTFGKWNAPSCLNLNCEWCRVFVYSPIFVRVFGFVRYCLASCMLEMDSVLVFLATSQLKRNSELWELFCFYLLIRFVPDFKIWSCWFLLKEIHHR